MNETTWSHTTVLLHEAIDALVTSPDGTYVDGTFGRGGHSRAILERLIAGDRATPPAREAKVRKRPRTLSRGRPPCRCRNRCSRACRRAAG